MFADSELISVGVDYVTATKETGTGSTTLGRWASEWLHEERKQGNEVREFSSHGYHGLWCGSIGVATNGTRLLVKVGGTEAQAHAADLFQHADSISRLDLQTTARIPHVPTTFAERMERKAKRYKLKHSLHFDVDLRRHDRKGKTLYLGSRTSERFIRLYDKGKESGLAELTNCWRAEIQFAKPLSESRAEQLLQMKLDQPWISEVVLFELARRGIPWIRLQDGAVTGQPLQTLRKRPSLLSRVEWLRKQVKPTVDLLFAYGYGAEALKALGLAHEGENNVRTTTTD